MNKPFLAPGVHILSVQHDSWCRMLKKGKAHGPCNCSPDHVMIPPQKIDLYLKEHGIVVPPDKKAK